MGNTGKKLLAAILSGLMLLSETVVLSGCGNSGEEQDTPEVSATTPETDTPYSALEKKTWNGQTMTVLVRDDSVAQFKIDSYGAEGNSLLDDCIYERNTVIEQDLDIKIETSCPGSFIEVNGQVVQQALGGTDDYDTFTGHKFTFIECAQNNYLLNLADVSTMNLTQPWWDAGCYRELTVNGKTVLMCGDILPMSLMLSACFVFNKKLMKDMNKELPYDAVKQGKWTLDMFNEMSADVTTDLNGDGRISYKDDLFGCSGWMMGTPFNMYYACGEPFIHINNDGIPELEYNQEKMMDIYSKIYQGMIAQKAYYCTEADLYVESLELFAKGRALFIDAALENLDRFSAEMTDDYGIIPQPKYSESQDNYYAFVNGASPFMGMIATEQNAEFVGAVLEAMGAYNYTTVSPMMFEIITKGRAARDPESAEMVDCIIRNRIFDFAYYFDLQISNVIIVALNGKNKSIASTIRSYEKMTISALKDILAAYEKM